MADMKKYLDTVALGTLVDQIKAEDAKVLASAKGYADSLATNYDGAGAAATAESNAKAYTDQLANGAVKTNTEAIAKLNGGADVEGSVAKAIADAKAIIDADIDAVDGKVDKNAEDIAAINHAESGILAQAKSYADGEVAEVQGNVDALGEFVGELPEGEESATVVAYIDKKTANIASDATVNALTERVTQAETDIDNIEKDYLKAADKTELEGKIDTAKASGDAAMEHSEGVAGDLAKEVKAREDADSAQVERIVALEGQITGLTGAMHFKGVVDALPEDVSSYVNGDVIVVGEKEYVFNAGAFVEFGDVSAEGERIAALETHKTAYEAKVATLESEMDDVQGAVATKAEQSALDSAVEALEGADTALGNRITNLEGKFGEGEGSVADMIADAKQEAIDAAADDATTKANAAEANAKGYADFLNTTMNTRVEALEAVDHSHANKEELDKIVVGDKAKWDAAEAKAHEHSNLSVLEAINAAKVSAWDAAEQAAKTYAKGLDDATNVKVDAIGERVGTLESDIATKAAQSDLNAAVARIAKNETDIAANTSAINSFAAITSDEVNALFA